MAKTDERRKKLTFVPMEDYIKRLLLSH